MSARILGVVRLGPVPYLEAHALQRRLADRRISGALPHDILLLLEHEPTITMGRGTRESSLPLSAEALRARGLTVVEVERGGDVTWHGPGQLVGYPILDLRRHREDLHWYLRQVEAVLIQALGRLEIPAERNPGLTGVWTMGRKIASIGIHVRHWVTSHGFALNVENSLADFDLIVPCGISGVEMTTVAAEVARSPGRHGDTGLAPTRRRGDTATLNAATLSAVTAAMAEVFGLEPVSLTLEEILPAGTEEPLAAL